MGLFSSLTSGLTRQLTSAGEKEFGRGVKFTAPGPSGFGRRGTPLVGAIPDAIITTRVPTPGPSPFTPGPIGTVITETAKNACLNIANSALRAICLAGGDVVSALINQGVTPPTTTSLVAPGPSGPCRTGTIRIGTRCVDISAALPGGEPFTTPLAASPQVVQGGFGLPATTPTGISRLVRRCARGMVLGIDNLCYAKAILPRRSKLRKWRGAPRPPISRRDTVAIRRAAGAKDRVLELAKDVGLHVSKSPHRRKKK